MTHKPLKITIAVSVLLLGVALLAYAGMRKAQVYYLEVDTFLGDSQFQARRVRLCGTVAANELHVDRASATARFVLLGRRGQVTVVYQGLLPEMFRPNADVVVDGKAGPDGTFRATQVMTKCAGKYRPAGYPAPPERSR